MTETPPSPGANWSDDDFRKAGLAALILITIFVCYFSHLGALGLTGPDEPRYVWIARDMAESGDWVTPRLYGRPWFEKPILYYWSAAASFKLFGVSETAARLPSALYALLATLSLAWLAIRLDGWETARWVLLFLPSCVAMIGFSHAASPDMPFTAMLTVAMVCGASVLGVAPSRDEIDKADTKPSRSPALFLFGTALGAAVLAKGPAALVLAGGAILIWSGITGSWRVALRVFRPVAVGAFLLTSVPWYILCARRNPDFLRVFIVEHNFRRYLTPEFQHLQPFWYYLPVSIAALLPWVAWLAWFALRESRSHENPPRRSQLVFIAAWAIFPLLFFSLSKSKLPGYILPAIPALIYLAVTAAVRSVHSKTTFQRYGLGASGIFFLACACAVVLSKTAGSLVLVFVFVATLGGLTIIFLAMMRQCRIGLLTAVVVQLFLLTLVYVSAAKLDSGLSARSTVARIDPALRPRTYSYKLQRAWLYQCDFYLHRELLEWRPAIEGDAVVITPAKYLENLKAQVEIVSVVSELSPQAVVLTVRPSAHPTSGGQPR
jgi:4-amino-4-deoxy-L-arabinose transferase-like glycosyltransferase